MTTEQVLPGSDQGEAFCTEAGSAVERVFRLLGKRWTGLIVASMMGGPVHFAEFRRAVPGISERVLSDRLTELAAAGLVLRQVDPGPPLRVSYRLTEVGAGLRPALAELGRWAEECLPSDAGCPGQRPTC
ncbi:helix-turn-helix transcriptional regulator [Streptacidiphilus sp. PB12-B1b]|uniref:winged helix-turn-helix transcriptional regulator n=1 Tax=Streptacidiphilus sp. PB12-B1b TaxID=2705012 RepID=UPI0015FC2DD7|nr:helix-turn-helix domain-containing protein [Streptacidiphilus sp. PB12-B1b]QMU75763.1 helix-turn-helix transcriptional regulator [Streptacidiphilus sp. PB12-B1b]